MNSEQIDLGILMHYLFALLIILNGAIFIYGSVV